MNQKHKEYLLNTLRNTIIYLSLHYGSKEIDEYVEEFLLDFVRPRDPRAEKAKVLKSSYLH